MKILTGIDIVSIERFEKSLEEGGQNFLKRIFSTRETNSLDTPHLAGKFAAKEALIKAFGNGIKNWLDFEIIGTNEKPTVVYENLNDETKSNIVSLDVSIAHETQFAVASAVVLLNS